MLVYKHFPCSAEHDRYCWKFYVYVLVVVWDFCIARNLFRFGLGSVLLFGRREGTRTRHNQAKKNIICLIFNHPHSITCSSGTLANSSINARSSRTTLSTTGSKTPSTARRTAGLSLSTSRCADPGDPDEGPSLYD